MNLDESLDEDEFVAVKDRATKQIEAVLLDEYARARQFLLIWRASIRERKRELDLRFRLQPGIAIQPLRKESALLSHEFTIHQIQRLQRRRAAHALGGDLPAIGTVEGPESRVLLHPHFGHINHSSPLWRAKFLFRIVNPHVVVVRLEGAESRTAGLQIQFPAHE